MRSAIALAKTARHRADDFLLLVCVHTAVAARNPDLRGILVSPAQPFVVDFRAGHDEKRPAVLHLVMPVAASGREETNVKPAPVGLAHDEVHVIQ